MMRLEVPTFPVERAVLGDRTAYGEGVLTVAPDVVRTVVLADARLGDVHVDIVQPGDRVRVLRALDAVEPLVKVAGPGVAFPGFLGPPHGCGEGRTHRRGGFSRVQVAE